MSSPIHKFVEFKCAVCKQVFYLPMMACFNFMAFLEKEPQRLQPACPYCNYKEEQTILAEATNTIVVMEEELETAHDLG